LIGETLGGKYAIIRLIRAGGMGVVYEAEQTDTHLRVAVKVMHERLLTSDKDLMRRFRREVRTASAMECRYIVQTLDAGTDAATGLSYLVMERLAGEDLQQLIDRTGPLPPKVALRIAAQALQGLITAHEMRIVHRDIKPANIFLARSHDDEITVKILDFGIAKIKADPLQLLHSTDLTTSSDFLGSPLYMSPEQVQSSSTVEHLTDIWSLGSVLFCTLAGRAPYHHLATLGQLIVAICASRPPPLQDVAPWVPRDVATIVDGALRSRPEERYPSAAAMLEAVRKALSPDGFMLRETMMVPLSDEERAVVAPRASSHRPSGAPRVVVRPPSTPPANRGGVESTVSGEDGAEPAPVSGEADPLLEEKLRLVQQESKRIIKALKAARWNEAEAARKLGIPLRNLMDKIKVFALRKPDRQR
jgi:eukaryotic-like serine/threonine-protein kinase